MQTQRYGRSFLSFKEGLLNSEGSVAIICSNSNFLYWAKRIVEEILGKPQMIQGNWCFYGDKKIYFVVISHPCDEVKLRGLDAKRLYCGGEVADAYLGVVRP